MYRGETNNNSHILKAAFTPGVAVKTCQWIDMRLDRQRAWTLDAALPSLHRTGWEVLDSCSYHTPTLILSGNSRLLELSWYPELKHGLWEAKPM